MPYVDEVKVTDMWFVPHFPPREDRLLEMTMLTLWKEYMKYEDNHQSGWCTRLADILSGIPRALNKRGGRVAATFAVWTMTPLGLAFMESLFRDIRSQDGNFFDERTAIRAWASENEINSMSNNRLECLLRDEYGNHVYKRNKYPTLEDHRVVEAVVCFFISEDGKDLLRKVTFGQSHRLRI